MFEDDDNFRKSHEEIRKMPLFKKGWELFELADKITEQVKQDGEYDHLREMEMNLLMHQADQLRGDAMMICPKISGAEGAELYDLRMENAAIIRKSARDVLAGCSGLELWGFKHPEYLKLLRDEVEEFRTLFAEWVKTFDVWNYTIDRWGLFNPPGINYDDKDPDDDLPFDPSDFLE
jgi:hypothetical protein